MPEMFQGENLKALYRDRLLVAAKIALKPEDARLERSREIAEVAEEILNEEDGQPKVVFAATILGVLASNARSYRGQAGSSGPEDSPGEITGKILGDLGTEKEVIEQVCRIIDDRIDGTVSEDINHKIVSDAVAVVDLLEKKSLLDETAIKRLIEQKLVTDTGKRLAKDRLLAKG
jgi:hypothetical protein